MLRIDLGCIESYDEETECFIQSDYPIVYEFEHSLYTIAMWEESFRKPFLNNRSLTAEDLLFYIACMGYRQEVDYELLDESHVELIKEYIDSDLSATTITKGPDDGSYNNRPTTSEELYAAMFEMGIDMSCEHWHISRLLKLFDVMRIRQGGSKKMSKQDIIAQNDAENARRLALYNTSG